MQTNAAQELLALCDRWTAGTAKTTAGQRGPTAGNVPSAELWKSQTLAVTLLAEIEAFHIAMGEDTSKDPFFLAMWNYIYAPNIKWFDSPSALKFDPMMRRTLSAISKLMAASDGLPSLDESELGALRDALERARELLGEAPGPVDDRRRHILYLLDRAIGMASGEKVDLLGLRSLTFEATGAAIGDQRIWGWSKAPELFRKLGLASSKFGARIAEDVMVDKAIEAGEPIVKALIEASTRS